MKLYYSPGACSLAAHILLNEINVDFDLERVDLKTHKTEKGADYYEINPKGYVPALEINPGLLLTENVAVLPFIAQHDPKQDLIPPSGLGRAKVLEWLGYLNSELHDEYAVFFDPAITEDEKVRGYATIDKMLKYIDDYLAESEYDYLVNDRFGPADAYLFVLTNWSNSIQNPFKKNEEAGSLRSKMKKKNSSCRYLLLRMKRLSGQKPPYNPIISYRWENANIPFLTNTLARKLRFAALKTVLKHSIKVIGSHHT